MIAVGVNSGRTSFGRSLPDGGTAVVIDDSLIFCSAEERISRVKKDGGWERSLDASMSYLGIDERDVTRYGVSTCIDTIGDTPTFSKAVALDHHLSHAASVYFTSEVARMVVLVFDAGGNSLGRSTSIEWWRQPRQQASYYLCEDGRITLVGRDFDKPFEAGIGEIYRAFTFFLGWHATEHAGKVMALAGLGDRSEAEALMPIFAMDEDSGVIRSAYRNDNPIDPIHNLSTALGRQDISQLSPRVPGAAIEDQHILAATYAQLMLENATIFKAAWLARRFDVSDVGLTGGVGYNCSMVQKLRNSLRPSNIHIHPASGDHGQCVGNAILAANSLSPKYQRYRISSCYLGQSYQDEDYIQSREFGDLRCKRILSGAASARLMIQLAEMLARGEIIAVCRGRSEYGPRALGNRSIVTSASHSGVKKRLNRAKSREDFMPFAPMVLNEKASIYFEDMHESPYMIETFSLRPKWRGKFCNVEHADNTCRVQTVGNTNNGFMFDLLRAVERDCGHPILLNTSLNLGGMPIAETPADALAAAISLNASLLILNDHVVDLSELLDSATRR